MSAQPRSLREILVSLAATGSLVAAVMVALAPWLWIGDLFSHWVGLLVMVTGLFLALSKGFPKLGMILCGSIVLMALPLLVDAWTRPAPIQGTEGGFSLVAANVAHWNEEPRDDTVEALLDLDPDVLVAVEVTPQIADALTKGLPDHHLAISGQDAWSVQSSLILSRFPIKSSLNHPTVPGGTRILSALLDTSEGDIQVLAVHPLPPLMPEVWHRYRQELRYIATLADSLPGRVVVAGDFNATPTSPSFRRALAGTGLQLPPQSPRTWPTPLAPFAGIAIDHVLTKGPMSVGSLASFAIPGSDHRGISARIYGQ